MKKTTLFALLLFFTIANLQAQVQVGNGTDTEQSLPFEPNVEYSYGQSIYLASEINVSGTITSLQWYYVGSGTMPNSEITLYLGHTTKSSFVDAVDWIPFTGLTQVYVGSIPTNSAPGWVTITFDTPFVYNGTDNLVVATHEGKIGFDDDYHKFYNFSVTGNRSLIYYELDVNPNPAFPPTDPDFNSLANYVPNIIFGGITPSCPTPLNLTSTNITSTSATVSWNAPATTPSGGSSYYISTTNTPPTAATVPTGSVGSGNSVSLSSLTPATTYYVWVKNNCGTESSAWSYSTTFTTVCVAVTSFSEGFDASLNLPTCWAKVGTLGYAEVQEDTDAPSTPNNLYIYSDDTTNRAVVSMPPVSNAGAGTHRLKFKARANSSFEIGGIVEVGYLTNPTDDASFVGVAQFATTSTTIYNNFMVELGTTPGTNEVLAFRHKGNPANAILIDDVVWEPIPSCNEPSLLTSSSDTSTGATVSWAATSSAPALGYEYYYSTTNTAPTASTTPSGSVPAGVVTANLTGLSPATTYYVWVRSKCSASDTSPWSANYTSFNTLCVIASFSQDFESTTQDVLPTCWSKILRGSSLSDDAYVKTTIDDIINGSVSVDLYNADSDTSVDDIMLVSPALTSLSSGLYRLKFNAKTLVYFGSGTGSVQIGTLDNNTNTAVFTPFSTVNITDQAAQYIVDFSTYTGTNQYIAFRMNDNDTYKDTILDNIVWELLPLCPDLTGITANTITTTSANITWIAGGNETQWDAVILPSTEMNPDNGLPVSATATNTSFSSLTPNTTYKVWVRSVCAGSANGYWIGPITFTTLCDATNVPYFQDFESVEEPAFPSCSVIQNAGSGNNWTTSIPDDSTGFTSNALTYKYNEANPANAWYFTQGINLIAGTVYEISYKYGDNYVDDYSEKMQVKYGTSPNQAGMTTLLADHPNINTDTAQTNSVSFTPTTTGVYYFGFNVYSDADQTFLFVDDILVTVNLSNDTFAHTNLKYYPNPVKDWLHISYNDTIDFVKLYTLLGQEVLCEKINSNQAAIQLSPLAKGTYMVKVFSHDKILHVKVVKE